MAVTAQQRAEVSQLYVAMFGRAPDGEGLGFWTQKMADGETITQIADQMYATSPARSYYPDFLTNEEIIGRFYVNVLGRTADTEGLNYWTAKLNAAGATPGSVIAEMVAVVASYTGTDAAGLESQKLFNNRAAVAQYYGEANLGVNTATTILSNVTSDTATVADAKVVIDANAAGSAGAFTLTNGTDIATASVFTAGLVYTPGGDDRINALQDEDQLIGTTGTTDRLDATLGNANDNGANIITPKLTDIETINVAFSGSGGTAVTALDLQDATGQTEVNITRVSQSINSAEVGNLMSPASKLSLANTNANTNGTVEFSYGADVLKGLTTGELTVDNVQLRILNLGENTSGIGARGVGINGFENLTLTSFGTATNTIGTLNLPMDTGTDGVLTIKGAANLRLGRVVPIVNAMNATLVEATEVWVAGTGLAQAGGRIKTIDASAFTGDLSIVLGQTLSVGKADSSGVKQDVTVKGGTGADTFALYEVVQAGDSIDGGNGNDTLLFYSGSALQSIATSIEAATMLGDGTAGNIALDFDFLPNATGMTVRNISAMYFVPGNPINAAEAPVTFRLTDLTAAQAAAITVQHSTTGNNPIDHTIIEAAVKTNTASDTLGVTIAEGTNVDPRFNFTIRTVVANTATSPTASASTFENLTITDSDSESNSVEIQHFAQFTGTIKLTGGVAGKYINLDVDTAGADVTANTAGTDGLAAGRQVGMLGIDVDGTAFDLAAGNAINVGALATEVRLQCATFDASAEVSDVIARFSTNEHSPVGAQHITMGSGNDVVIFDLINDSRAGLDVSDTVAGGAGNDTLVIDGHGVLVNLGASEWTNVSGFETLRLAGNQTVPTDSKFGQNSYNLTLTNEMIDANASDKVLNIVNDNDANNDTAGAADTVTIASNAVSGVTIDARNLDASHHFTYNGEEGVGSTQDRFIVCDANINGMNIIDGGALDNLPTTNPGINWDLLEIRNQAIVTAGDLANIKNVGVIAFNNDLAVLQTLTLEVTDSVVDAMVDSYHVATTAQPESILVSLMTGPLIGTAPKALILDASALTAKSGVHIMLDGMLGETAVDTICLSALGGVVYVGNFETTADGGGVTGTEKDKFVLSLSAFTALTTAQAGDVSDLSSVVGGLAATDFMSAAGISSSTSVLSEEIIFDTANRDLYYNTDGNVAGGLVLIAHMMNASDVAATDFVITS